MDVVALASANWGSSLWSFFLICGANRTAMCNGGFLHSMALGNWNLRNGTGKVAYYIPFEQANER